MDHLAFERAVRAVPWAHLQGAYGASDGSVEQSGLILGDVPGALVTLAQVTDPEGDDAGDALDVLLSHAWHQGDVYEVTAHVVSFVFELVAAPEVVVGGDLAHWLATVADAARRYVDSHTLEVRADAEAVFASLARHRGDLLGWLGGEHEAAALCVASRVPALRDDLLRVLQARPRLSAAGWLALADLEAPPAWALDRATTALDDTDADTRVAAALLLARRGRPEGEVARRVEAALAPGAVEALYRAVEVPFDLEETHFTAPFDGPLEEATVLFAGVKLVTVRVAGPRNVNLPWPGSALAKGEVIEVGLSPHGAPRVAVRRRPDGTTERVMFP